MKKEKISRRPLILKIETVGKVAFDTELFVAQQEYIEAIKTKEKLGSSNMSLVKGHIDSLVRAAKQRLLLMGMSTQEIEEIVKNNQANQDLYMSSGSGQSWVYLTVYEYEAGLIKEGLDVVVDVEAYPGQTFTGSIVSLSPVLNNLTRSLIARARVEDKENKLKPEMLVNAAIEVDLGESLVVPSQAVINTGEREMVFVSGQNGHFYPRTIKTGQKTDEYYQILSGLSEQEEVVTSGNFFIDSESKLKEALSPEHKHK